MREILFRGKTIEKNKWYYGSYLFCHLPDYDWTGKASAKCEDVHYIVNKEDINLAVYPDTIGQYTGLNDKNGTKIFEYDIIKIHCEKPIIALVRYIGGAFEIVWDKDNIGDITRIALLYQWRINFEYEVIGNYFDNPDLLTFSLYDGPIKKIKIEIENGEIIATPIKDIKG